jgi:hypothetical protein
MEKDATATGIILHHAGACAGILPAQLPISKAPLLKWPYRQSL